MPRMLRAGPVRLLGSRSQWAAIAVAAGLGIALFTLVDLTPQIQADFFFSNDDPQLQGSRGIEREFGEAPQVSSRRERSRSCPKATYAA